MARAMLAAVFFIIIMSVGASAIAYQGDSLGNVYDIDTETLSSETSTFAEGELVNTTNSHIEDADYDDDAQVVVVDSNGVEMVEGDDFEWNENNGSLTILSGSDLTDDATLDVDYGFVIASQQQQEVVSLVGAQVGIGQALMYVFGAVLAIAMVRIFAGMG